jgi:hypothetical protein
MYFIHDFEAEQQENLDCMFSSYLSDIATNHTEQDFGGLWQSPAQVWSGRDYRPRPPGAYEHQVVLAMALLIINELSQEQVQDYFEEIVRGQCAVRWRTVAFNADAWEAVKSAVSWLWDNVIKPGIDNYIAPALNGIKEKLSNYFSGFLGFMISYTLDPDNYSNEDFLQHLFGDFYPMIEFLMDMIDKVSSFISPFINAIKDLATKAIDIIIGLIKTAFGGERESIEDEEAQGLTLSTFLDYISDKIVNEDGPTLFIYGSVTILTKTEYTLAIVGIIAQWVLLMVALSKGVLAALAILGFSMALFSVYLLLKGAEFVNSVLVYAFGKEPLDEKNATFWADTVAFAVATFSIPLTAVGGLQIPFPFNLILLAIDFFIWGWTAAKYYGKLG